MAPEDSSGTPPSGPSRPPTFTSPEQQFRREGISAAMFHPEAEPGTWVEGVAPKDRQTISDIFDFEVGDLYRNAQEEFITAEGRQPEAGEVVAFGGNLETMMELANLWRDPETHPAIKPEEQAASLKALHLLTLNRQEQWAGKKLTKAQKGHLEAMSAMRNQLFTNLTGKELKDYRVSREHLDEFGVNRFLYRDVDKRRIQNALIQKDIEAGMGARGGGIFEDTPILEQDQVFEVVRAELAERRDELYQEVLQHQTGQELTPDQVRLVQQVDRLQTDLVEDPALLESIATLAELAQLLGVGVRTPEFEHYAEQSGYDLEAVKKMSPRDLLNFFLWFIQRLPEIIAEFKALQEPAARAGRGP